MPATAVSTANVMAPMTKYTVLVNGAPLPASLELSAFSVDTSLRLPAMATVVLLEPTAPDRNGSIADELVERIGQPVEISAAAGEHPESLLFKGEILRVETHADARETPVVLRCADKLRRLYAGRMWEAYQNAKYSDIATKVLQRAGLKANVTASPLAHPLVIQRDESDGEFLERLAAEIGYVLYVDKATEAVVFGPPPPLKKTTPVPKRGQAGRNQVIFGEDLISYEAIAGRPAISSVTAVGWDIKQKQPIKATKSVADGFKTAAVGFDGKPEEPTKTTIAPMTYLNATDAASGAQAVADHLASGTISFRGRLHGNPYLSAGVEVAVGGAGKAFNGHYLITSCRHVFDDGGLQTEITCDGLNDRARLLGEGHQPAAAAAVNPMPFATTATVTNTKDPEKLGRVKVAFPSWGPDTNGNMLESDWMRVIATGAGKERGISWLPEVNDEVVTIFDRGDVRSGYVLGGLHNGVDKPPAALGTEQGVNSSSGEVDKKGLVTRALHRLLFNDKKGEESVELHVKDTLITMKFDAKTKTTTITVDNKEIFTMESGKGITVESKDGDITMKGTNIKLEAKSNFEVKANAKATIEAQAAFEAKGVTAKVQGQGQAELSSSGQTTVKGTMVMIN